jgi:hypothetical protein
MSYSRAYRNAGQRNLARYRHTQSCIRVAGQAPGREREQQIVRCRLLWILLLILLLPGIAAVFV